MRRLFLILFISSIVAGCKNEPKTSYIINGKAEGVYNGVRVFLNDINERGIPTPVDTTMVMNETFVFEGSVDHPKLQYIIVNGIPGRLPVMVENGVMQLNINNKIIAESEFIGSDSHDIYANYNKEINRLKENINNANTNLRNSNFLRDSTKIESDKLALQKANSKFNDFTYDYIENNSDNFAILPIFSNQLRNRNVDMERMVSLYDQLDEDIKISDQGKQIQTTINLIKTTLEAEKATAIGAQAPEFSAPSPDGDIIALSDVVKKGKITIIDFWAAWCGPCRRENPNVVKVYEKYHDKGLEIIGVGLDGRRGQQNPKEAWIKAIENDNLTWHQVSNLSYFDEIAQLYNVRSIPSMFVLDDEGKIVAKNLRGLALENKIAELLN